MRQDVFLRRLFRKRGKGKDAYLVPIRIRKARRAVLGRQGINCEHCGRDMAVPKSAIAVSGRCSDCIVRQKLAEAQA